MTTRDSTAILAPLSFTRRNSWRRGHANRRSLKGNSRAEETTVERSTSLNSWASAGILLLVLLLGSASYVRYRAETDRA